MYTIPAVKRKVQSVEGTLCSLSRDIFKDYISLL